MTCAPGGRPVCPCHSVGTPRTEGCGPCTRGRRTPSPRRSTSHGQSPARIELTILFPFAPVTRSGGHDRQRLGREPDAHSYRARWCVHHWQMTPLPQQCRTRCRGGAQARLRYGEPGHRIRQRSLAPLPAASAPCVGSRGDPNDEAPRRSGPRPGRKAWARCPSTPATEVRLGQQESAET